MHTTGSTDSPSGSDVPPIPTPDKDGIYTCNICRTKVRVGRGGHKNFMQHSGSPRCLRAAKKGELKSQKSQTRSRMRTLHSYFMKTLTETTCDGPKDGPSHVQDGKQNGLGSEDSSEVALTSKTTSVHATFCTSATQLAQSSPLPTSPHVSSLPTSGPPHEPRVGSLPADGVTSKSAYPDGHVLTPLNSITCSAQELPSHIPEAEEGDNIACVVLAGGPSSAPSDTPPSDPDGAPPQKLWMCWAKPLESPGEYGLGELGGSDEGDVGNKSESATGAVKDAVAESDEHAPSISSHFHHLTLTITPSSQLLTSAVPVLPPADIPACHTSGVTKHSTGTEDEGGGLLKGTQMSEFGCKRKLHNMHNVSACLCGKSAGPSAAQMAGDEVVYAELLVVKQNG
ncbi:hypothetical protein EDB92DRAFT_1864458 [Lactarius akahatsu]|uniref:Uncharacterized protein n=1 Tax=Lactarius akahatsu TaxID=416441 RepID=A0AAD4LGA4_9AGAM|nr:hypothetical protein EDB92DRAFT_1864458 [Lactarius akahatsu]